VVIVEQQAVFQQHQAQVVGGVAGCVDDLQGVACFTRKTSLGLYLCNYRVGFAFSRKRLGLSVTSVQRRRDIGI
jgi:hypothetical protein